MNKNKYKSIRPKKMSWEWIVSKEYIYYDKYVKCTNCYNYDGNKKHGDCLAFLEWANSVACEGSYIDLTKYKAQEKRQCSNFVNKRK